MLDFGVSAGSRSLTERPVGTFPTLYYDVVRMTMPNNPSGVKVRHIAARRRRPRALVKSLHLRG